MIVGVFESNLMWSEKLRRNLIALGHEPIIIRKPVEPLVSMDIAIINLGSADYDPVLLLAKLKGLEVKTIAHAGHKEKPLLELGRVANADYVSTNSEITHSLQAIFEKISK